MIVFMYDCIYVLTSPNIQSFYSITKHPYAKHLIIVYGLHAMCIQVGLAYSVLRVFILGTLGGIINSN